MYSSDRSTASGVSAPKVNNAVSATGPVCRYFDETNSAASSEGRAVA